MPRSFFGFKKQGIIFLEQLSNSEKIYNKLIQESPSEINDKPNYCKGVIMNSYETYLSSNKAYTGNNKIYENKHISELNYIKKMIDYCTQKNLKLMVAALPLPQAHS